MNDSKVGNTFVVMKVASFSTKGRSANPIDSLASSTATLILAIRPENVLAATSACPANVTDNALTAASKSLDLMIDSSSGTPSLFRAPKFPS